MGMRNDGPMMCMEFGTADIPGHFACESRGISGHFGGIGGIVDVRGEAKRGIRKAQVWRLLPAARRQVIARRP